MSGELSLGTLSGRIELEDNLTPAVDAVGKKVDELGDKFGSLGAHILEQTASFFTAEAALEGIKKVGEKLVEEFELLTLHGSVVVDISNNYERLTRQAGLLGEELLGDLKTATHGTIDDFQLMKRVNEDFSAGAHLTNEQLVLLAQGGFALAKAQGIDAKVAIDSLNDAMVTGRVRGVAYLTGKIDLKDAEEKFAAAAGHTVDELSAEGKLEAGRVALLEKVTQRLGEVGDQQDTLKNKVEQAQASWANFEDDLDKSVASSAIVKGAFADVEKAIEDAFGANRQELIEGVTHTFEGLVRNGEGVAKLFINLAKLTYDYRGALEALAVALASYATASVAANAISLVMNSSLTALSFTTIPNVIASFQLMGGAILSSLGPVGIVAAGVTAAWEAWKSASAEKGWIREISDGYEYAALRLGGYSAAQADAMIAQQHLTEQTKTAAVPALQSHATAALSTTGAVSGLGKAVNDTSKFFQESKTDAKAYADAWSELSTIGATFADTIAGINPKILQQVEYYLQAGAAIGVVTKAYPMLSEAQVKAVSDMLRSDEKVMNELEKVTLDYYRVLEGASHDTLSAQINDAYLSAQARIDAMMKAKTYSVEAEQIIWKTAEQTANNIIQKQLESDVHSREHYQLLADEAKNAFEFAQAHAESYTAKWINHLGQAATAAQKTADEFASSFHNALQRVDDDLSATIEGFHQLAMASAAASVKGDATGPADTIEGRLAMFTKQQSQGQFINTSGLFAGLPHRASGGSASAGRPIVVGENEPEVFVPDSSGTIIPSLGGGGGNLYISAVFQGMWDPATASKAADLIGAAIVKKTGRKFGRA